MTVGSNKVRIGFLGGILRFLEASWWFQDPRDTRIFSLGFKAQVSLVKVNVLSFLRRSQKMTKSSLSI